MYKIIDLCIDASVVISLFHKDNNNNSDYSTEWELFECDIYDELDGYIFDKKPTMLDVEKLLIDLFESYVYEVMGCNCVSSMHMDIVKDGEECEFFYTDRKYDEEGKRKARSEGMLILDDLSWGFVENIDLKINSYEIEKVPA